MSVLTVAIVHSRWLTSVPISTYSVFGCQTIDASAALLCG
jgi:hypothetical protein